MPEFVKKNIRLVILLFIGIGIGIYIGLLLGNKPGDDSSTQISEEHGGQQKLTNPLLDYKIPPSKELGSFRVQINSKIDEYIKNQKALTISFYYRDLNNGPWIGVNEKEKYTPASMLKVPLMIAYFKMAEKKPDILSQKYLYDNSLDLNTGTYYKIQNPIQKGTEYTVEELINHMIKNSDNNAMMLLYNNVDQNVLNNLYNELGTSIPKDTSEDFMSPVGFSVFFRVLYNTTYLNQQDSEKALDLLSQVNFDKGITQGLPKDIVVAQKYGEKVEDEGLELHSCGIVYYPNHPYLLCIMTQGQKYDDLSKVIGDLSRFTYEQIKKSNQ